MCLLIWPFSGGANLDLKQAALHAASYFNDDFTCKRKYPLSSSQFKVLNDCVESLAKEYSTPLFIGEGLSLSRIFNILNNVPGVNDAVKVQIINKNTSNYSSVFFSINENMSPDGDTLVCPKNAIFEMKFPEVDIKGKLR